MATSIQDLGKKLTFNSKDVFLVFLFSFLIWIFICFIFLSIVKVLISPSDKSYLKIFLSQPQILSMYILSYYSIAILLTWFCLIKKIPSRLRVFFDKARLNRDLIDGFELFVKSLGAVVLFFMLLIFLFAILSRIFGLDYDLIKNTYLEGREAEISDIYKIYKLNFIVIFLAVILGPFYEEIFYRGCLYTALRKRQGMWKSIWISSLFFALIHGYVFNFFPVLLLGIILGYAYEKRGSLTASLVLHFCWNAFSTLFFLLKV